MTPTIALVLLAVAAALAAADVVTSRGRAFAGWAALLVAVVLILERIG